MAHNFGVEDDSTIVISMLFHFGNSGLNTDAGSHCASPSSKGAIDEGRITDGRTLRDFLSK